MKDEAPGNDGRHGIISACSWTVDRIKLIDQWPEQEHLAQISTTDQQGGGCGHNLGVDIRRLNNNIPVEAIGLVGNDTDGQFLLDNVASVGIDITQLKRTTKASTSFTDVFTVTGTGKRTFFHHPGCNDCVTPDDFDFSQCPGKILHLGLLGVHAAMANAWQQDSNGWVTVLRAAQGAGIHTNLELVSVSGDRIREIALPCVAHINSVIANEYELGALAGHNICSADNHIDEALFTSAAEKLFKESNNKQGQLSLVVAHSPGAAFAMTSDGKIHRRESFTVNPAWVVSTVGAGDAFAAGMLYGIHEHWPLDDALELAHATAAASLRSATTVGSVDTVDACLHFARNVAATRP